MTDLRVLAASIALAAFAGCGASKPQAAAIGEAYAGPAELELRQEILPSSPKVGTARHGEKLEIVQVRRKFYRVRTPSGAEGWTHERSLLSREEIDALSKLREAGAKQPSQGTAMFSQATNVHTEPVRSSPSFTQVEENEKIAILRHQITPRATQSKRKSLLPPTPPKPRKKKAAKEKKHVDKKGNPLPPFPKAPAPPADWVELSRNRTYERLPEPPVTLEKEKPSGPVNQPMDEWTLVRRANGDAGWVLRGRLMLDLPDYILQHAEGKRITSYFILGQTEDKGVSKPVYLWTTVSNRYADFDFDLMRLFFWNARRQRYETGYIERNMRGFLPIVTEQVNPPRGVQSSAKMPGISLVVEKDGRRVRRFYAYLGDRIRLSGEEQVASSGDPVPVSTSPVLKTTPKAKPSWFSRVKRRIAQAVRVGDAESSGL